MENNANVKGTTSAMDHLGRVVFPKEICRAIGAKEGDRLDILVMTDGTILLRKAVDNQPMCDCSCVNTPVKKENRVVHFIDNYNEVTKVVKITNEQDNLLNWLINNEYLSSDVDVNNGYPDIEDLT